MTDKSLHFGWNTFKVRLFLFAQRYSALAPGWVKKPLRGILSPKISAGDIAGIEDWSRPLVDRPDAPPMRWPEATRHEDAKAGSDNSQPEIGIGEIRCLLATESLDAGGMDEVVGFLARGLPQFGLRIAIAYTPSDRPRTLGRLGQVLREEGVEVVEINSSDFEGWVRNWRPDVVSVHGAPQWVLEAASACSVPIVETLHGLHNQFNAAPSEVTSRRRLLAGLVSVSDMVREQYLAIDDDCDPDFVVTIPNGVVGRRHQSIPRDRARRLLGLGNEYLFVSLSRHCLQKNTYGLASAFSEVADAVPESHLLICGRPDDAEYARQVVTLRTRMRHGDRLHLRDHTQHPGVLLSAADGFVLNSFFEGWALASMEALTAGLPVIVSDVGGAREQLAGRPDWGLVVSNPLGNPLEVDWHSMMAARFQRQPNKEELVSAMITFSRDRIWSSRENSASEAARRFDGVLCLQRHAGLLKAAAAGEPLVLTGP